jgi:hypothetical protein
LIGDSALVLSKYAKDVHSIELSSANYLALNPGLHQIPTLSANVRTFHMSVSDQDGETSSVGVVADQRLQTALEKNQNDYD